MLRNSVFFLPASELGREIRARRISPVELTEGYLARIRRHAPGLNAFATVTPELALEQARLAEREISRGMIRGPLHGVPYGAKDLLATVGTPTTWGARGPRAISDSTRTRPSCGSSGNPERSSSANSRW